MRLTSIAVLAFVSSVALVGCGDDGGSITADDSPTTTAKASGAKGDSDHDKLVAAMLSADDSFMDEKQAGCVADELDGKLTDKGFDMLSDPDSQGDLTDLAKRDADAVVDAFDTCIEMSDMASLFTESFAGSAGIELNETEAVCARKRFAEQYDGAGQFIMALNEMSEDELGSSALDTMASCVSDETITTFMSKQFTDSGLDQATADCVAGTLVEGYGAEKLFRELSEIGNGGESEELKSATEQATVACVGDGSGVTVPSIGGGLGSN